jgi:AP endonuclease-2
MFDILEADIVVMQETKIQRRDLGDDMVLVPGWDVYFSLPKHKKGMFCELSFVSICAPNPLPKSSNGSQLPRVSARWV